MSGFDNSLELESRIENLKSELDTYGRDIKSLVSSIYGVGEEDGVGPINNSDFKNSPFQLISLLRQEVVELIQESQQHEDVIIKSQADIKFCDEISSILSNVSLLVEKMNQFEDCMIKFRFQNCLDLLGEMASLLAELPTEESYLGKGKICRTLRSEHKMLKVRLSTKIIRLLNECVVVDVGSIRVNKSLSGYVRSEDKIVPEPVSLNDLWSFVIDCEVVDEVFDQILSNIWGSVFSVLWKEKKTQIPKITTSPESSEIVIIISRGAGAPRDFDVGSCCSLGASKMPVPDLFELIGHFVNFIWTEVFVGDHDLAVLFGRKLFSEPFNFIHELTETVSLHLPKSESEVSHYRKSLEDASRVLQNKLQSFFGLAEVSATLNIDATPLTNHVENLFSIFSFIRRRDILKHAREIVMGDYHNTMIASGDVLEDELSTAGDIGDARALLDQSGSIAIQRLKFDSCQVSLASCRLLKFVNEVMVQTLNASTEVANILFHSARDCIELFLIVVPTKFAETIEAAPRMGAVFFNDCLYIAHNLVLITHRYRQLLQNREGGFQNAISFVDFVPRLRKTAEKVLHGHVSSQQAVLKEMVERIKISPDKDSQTSSKQKNLLAEGIKMAGKLKNQFLYRGTVEGMQGLSMSGDTDATIDTIEDDSPANNENRAGILLAHLERLSTQWLGVLQEDFYARMMGLLVDNVLLEAMKPVLAADCITATAASEIHRIFKVLQRSKALLPSTNLSLNDRESLQAQSFKELCPSFDKFCALTDIMEFKLNDIANGLNRKKFVDFTAAEMVKLVKALFEDSPRRQSLLNAIDSLPTK